MMQRIREVWKRLFPESIGREMAEGMLTAFAAQVTGF